MPSVYGFHNVPPTEDVYTDFFVVVGEDMMWPGEVGRSQKEVTDDIGSTILIVENFGANIHWMEPRDLHFDTMSFQMQDPQGLSSRYKNPAVALADGAVLRLEADMPDFLLRALLTINGGEALETKEQYTTFMEDGRLRQFNLSCLITKDFMEAVKNDQKWKVAFPVTAKEAKDEGLDLENEDQVVWRNWPVPGKYLSKTEGKDTGKVACRVYKVLPAKRLWDIIMSSTYDYAEPGFILIDRVNEMNNNWFCENIRATNPCGEQPLPPYGACLLGSVNLTKFVKKPFTEEAQFDWDKYKEVVSIFTRMLDNVVEINGLPLGKQRDEIVRKRRHGMGYLGLGSTLSMMGLVYGDEESLKFTEEVSRILAEIGWQVGIDLAKEKGPAPIMDEEFEVTASMLLMRPEMKKDGIKVGDKLKGKVLLGKYSRYMQQFPAAIQAQIAKDGCRFTHHSSIAPTGTISLSLANNASNGIEPSFAHHYSRNVIREGKKSKEKVDVFSYELLAYRALVNPKAMPFSENADEKLPDYFIDSSTIKAKAHVDIQAAAQKWIDSSISKTINVPTDYDYEDFKEIYLYAYEKGLKGCTTFRFNPEAFQGVLVTEKDLENTSYKFTLDDGQEVEVKGNEEIEYDGEVHSAANLYDALKEGYYGKF